MKIVNVQGRKKTGKTTTVTNIIAELVRRGYSVGSVKGIHIDGFTMDVEGEDTGKHKAAGASPVTARCHDETNIMFTRRMGLAEILQHYHTDWVVIESHVDLSCPNIITGRTAEYVGQGKDVSLAEQINELTIGCSGVISNEIDSFRGLPVINSTTDIEALVDLIEAKTGEYRPAEMYCPSDYPSDPEQPSESMDLPLIETNEFVRVDKDGNRTGGTDTMMNENTVTITVNGVYAGNVPCTPQYMKELVLGWLLYEGRISGMEEVQSLCISEDQRKAEVVLKDESITPQPGRIPLRKVPQMEWNRQWIFDLAEDFEHNLPLRAKTMAAHNCRLARPAEDGKIEILFKCEDIGRHSAIDKVIGWGMEQGIDFSKCVLFTSGRISRAMTQKVISAGIPLMAGKGTISKRAVELAKDYNLILIGYSHKDSLCIFCEGTR